jgi:hypothetical protein
VKHGGESAPRPVKLTSERTAKAAPLLSDASEHNLILMLRNMFLT